MVTLDLPPGYTARPLSRSDATAVFAVMAAQEKRDIGSVAIEEADIVGDWQRPSFDVSAGTLGVFAGDALVAYGEYSGADRGDAAVHPDHRGRGIGIAIARWMQDTARAAGATVIGMPVPQDSPGDRLLAALGYRVRWTSWILQLPAGNEIAAQPLPPGHVVRAAHTDEYEAVWSVVEDAFLEWSVRDRYPFDDWAATVTRRPGFEPWNLRVVVAPSGEVLGAAFVVRADNTGYIDKLAVRRDQRGRGLARALLADAFRTAREHGATTSELSTDSRTGALGLYEKVGMEVTSVWVNRAISL